MSVNSCNSWLLSAHSSLQNYREETCGEGIAGIYDAWCGEVDDAVPAVLREFARGGRALKLGIGAGRVALPLH
jgi:hypothetical protein